MDEFENKWVVCNECGWQIPCTEETAKMEGDSCSEPASDGLDCDGTLQIESDD